MDDSNPPFNEEDVSPELQRLLDIARGIFEEDASDEVKTKKFDTLMSVILDCLSDERLAHVKQTEAFLSLAPGNYRESFIQLIDGKIALRQIRREMGIGNEENSS